MCAIDYYLISEFGKGCCLNCPYAYPGCLCYECKCKNCYWYSSPEEYDFEKGHCDKTDELKEKKKEEVKLRYQRQDQLEWKKSQALEKENERILEIIKTKNKTPNYYTCQSCKREFVTEKIYFIILKQTPACAVCNENIKVK